LPMLLPNFHEIGPYFPYAAALACGFVMADSVPGSGTVAPGKCLRGSRSGLATNQDRICSHSPSKGLCGCAANPRRIFASLAHGIRSRVLLWDREHFLSREAALPHLTAAPATSSNVPSCKRWCPPLARPGLLSLSLLKEKQAVSVT
jgi:hypothetical protein